MRRSNRITDFDNKIMRLIHVNFIEFQQNVIGLSHDNKILINQASITFNAFDVIGRLSNQCIPLSVAFKV